MERSASKWVWGAAALAIGVALGAALALWLPGVEPPVAGPDPESAASPQPAAPDAPEPERLRGELAELKLRLEQQSREIERLRAEAERELAEERASSAAGLREAAGGQPGGIRQPAANLKSPIVRRPDPRLRPAPPEPPSVRAGLTQREVSTIAGPPESQHDHGSDGIEWVYACPGGGNFSVYFEPDSHTVDRTHSYGGCAVRPDGR